MTLPFLPANEICSGFLLETKKDFVIIKMRRVPPIRLPLKLTPDISYLSGVIVGDGCMTITSRGKLTKYPRTKITIYNNSRSFLEEINNLFESSLGVKGRIFKKSYNECWVLEINKKSIWIYFRDIIGLKPKRKFNLKVPPSVKSKRLFRHFIAGLFDTDGYFSKNFGIMMNGTNFGFLEEIRNLMNQFYNINFLEPKMNQLKVNEKTYSRTYMNLSKTQSNKFRQAVPMLKKG